MDLAERMAMLESKLAKLDERVITLEGQFDFISRQLRDLQMFVHTKFEQVDRRLDTIDRRLDKIDRRLDKIDGRLDKIDVRLDTIDGRLDRIEITLKEMPRAIIEAIRETKLG